jgi:hypothetical protein
MNIINFDNAQTAPGAFYGGNAGAKDAIIFENSVYMVKYPKTTRDLVNPQISYTTSPLSEYLGSKVYEVLGIPVHETRLGVRRGKVVVACRDFTREAGESFPGKMLIPFHDLKNSFMSTDLESYSGTGSETLLDEVLATVNGQEYLKSVPGVTERFWDMFVIDAFIGNNDRNNGNWGLLSAPENGKIALAPVYDNGNAFFNKRSIAQMEKRISDNEAMHEDAYKTITCAFKYTGLDNEGHKINPFEFIARRENEDCNAAVERFCSSVDMTKMENLIAEIPETTGVLSVMPKIQKEFYSKLLQIRYDFLRGQL